MLQQTKTKLLTLYQNELKIEINKEKLYQDDSPNPHTKNIEILNKIINKLKRS